MRLLLVRSDDVDKMERVDMQAIQHMPDSSIQRCRLLFEYLGDCVWIEMVTISSRKRSALEQ